MPLRKPKSVTQRSGSPVVTGGGGVKKGKRAGCRLNTSPRKVERDTRQRQPRVCGEQRLRLKSLEDGMRKDKSQMICHSSGFNCDPHWTVWLPLPIIRYFQKRAGHDGTQAIVVDQAKKRVRGQAESSDNPALAQELLSLKRARMACHDSHCSPHWRVDLNEEEIRHLAKLLNTDGTRGYLVRERKRTPSSRGSDRVYEVPEELLF